MKLNLGCGSNRLIGWENHDMDVDITKPLPFANDSVECVLLEHVIEHITIHQAWDCLDEVYRILQPDGLLRICFPNIFKVLYNGYKGYDEFIRVHGWGDGTRKGSVKALLFCHGHQMAWSFETMEGVLGAIGFKNIEEEAPRMSSHPCFFGVDGHGRVLGEEFNDVETTVVEAQK